MNRTISYITRSEDRTNYYYHSLIKLDNVLVSRRRIQQVANKYQHLGLHYSLQQDCLNFLCCRRRNDSEVLEALTELACVLPQEICYRVKAVSHDEELDYGFLLYAGSLYRLDSLAHPTRPRRLIIGQRAAA